jgi:uncharacterized protein (DUF952 family)
LARRAGAARVSGAMGAIVYKICARAAWEAALAAGRFEGSADDRRDGFIHLSAAGQVADTAARHFAGAGDLVLVAVDAGRLGAALRWEPARGGALFPHLYAALPVDAALWTRPLPLEDGRHVLPPELG